MKEDNLNHILLLINKARNNGISLFLEEGKVKMKVAKNTIAEAGVIDEIKRYREEIKQLLSQDDINSPGIERISRHLREETTRVPLSFGQERLWFIDQLEGSIQYHLYSVLRLKGQLNEQVLENAFRNIVERHEVLRTVFEQDESGVYQRVKKAGSWQLNITEHTTSGNLPSTIDAIIQTPFDLSADYMLRANLIRKMPEEWMLIVVMHHIASDAWSIPILVKELSELYESAIQERPSMLRSLETQYGDYSIWQRKYLQGELLENKLAYWERQLSGAVPIKLPADYNRPPVQSTNGNSIRFEIDKETMNALQLICKEEGVTLFMILLAIFKVLFYRYSGQDDICIGVPVSGREQPETNGLIGFFINTVVLRTIILDNPGFSDFLGEIKKQVLDAFEHQEIPFEKVVEVLNVKRDRSRHPIFDVKFSYQHLPQTGKLNLGSGLELAEENFRKTDTQLDISLDVMESSAGLRLDLTYCKDVFKQETIGRMGAHLKQLISAVVENPSCKIGDLQMITPEELGQWSVFNNTSVSYPRDKTVVDIFEEIVGRYPEKIAVIFEEEQLTYRELNEKSNQLALYLRSKGVGPDVLVPVCKEKSIAQIIGIFAVMKAGGAYVPVDPEYPAERIQYIIADCNAKVALIKSDASVASKFTEQGHGEIELISLDDSSIFQGESANLPTNITPSNLTYCIYTSGTTGTPKGVLIEHLGAVNVALHHIRELQVTPEDRIVQFFSSSFDASLLDIFTALLGGAALVLPSHETVQDVSLFLAYLEEKRVSVFTVTPSYLNLLGKAEMPFLRILITGGEPCRVDDAMFYSRFKQFYNAYGPSEATVNATLYKVEDTKQYEQFIPIGKPSDNKRIYIGKDRQLCPVGIAGEIYIGGTGLARGYLGNQELTQTKFVANPFEMGTAERLYRTGDLGRWLPDGNIEYLGRVDEQVKIRGFRVEPGEIESVLLQSGLVSQAVVLGKEDALGNKLLTAYVVSNGVFDKEEMVNYLETRLPAYMIPSFLIQVENIPLTPNGKIDKKSLPDPVKKEVYEDGYVLPDTPLEKLLVTIWQNLLGVDRISVKDDFFELGGHSLLAIKLVSAIRKELGIDLSIADVFDYLTIQDQASFLESRINNVSLPPIEKQPDTTYIPLSFAQERLWFIDQLEGSVQYHVPIVLRIRGHLNKEALEGAFSTIVQRHEVLRTVIEQHHDQTCQKIGESSQWKLNFITGITKENEKGLLAKIDELVRKPFDLTKDYMLKVSVIHLSAEEHILIVLLHHIVADAWSFIILEKEFVEIYNSLAEGRNYVLPELTVQYADYAIWQRKYLQGEIIDKQLAYWEAKLRGLEPLHLPLDGERRSGESRQGDEMSFSIDENNTAKIKALMRQHDATLFMVMLAAFKALLYRYTGQEDIAVCGTIANRSQHEVSGLIGLFVNMIVLRDEITGDMNFIQLLEKVRQTTKEAYENHEAPFEKVAEKLLKGRDPNGSAFFQIWLVVQNKSEEYDRTKEKMTGVELTSVSYGNSPAKSDIGVIVVEEKETLRVNIIYCRDLFRRETIAGIQFYYEQLLFDIISNPLRKITEMLPHTAIRHTHFAESQEIDYQGLFDFDFGKSI